MSYATVLDGYHTAFATLDIPVILDYEPSSINAFPTLYSLLEGAEYIGTGGAPGSATVKETRYSILHRLLFRWQDNERAEQELIPFVDSLPAAVHADRRLGGAITNGMAHISNAEAVYVDIGGVRYRALDFHSVTLDKSL